MVVRKTFFTLFNTEKERYALATVAGIVINILRATVRLGNKFSRFEVFIALRRSQGGSVFSPKLAEYISFELRSLSVSSSPKSFEPAQ